MAIRQRTGNYWEQRSLERLTATERASNAHLQDILDVYDNSRRSTVRSVKAMYETYYKDNGFDMQGLNSIAPSGDLARFYREMRDLGLDTHLPDNYKGRLSRLELLNAQMWGESKKAAQRHQIIQTKSHKETIDYGYHRTIYDVSKGIGSTPEFSQLNTKTIDQILNTKFNGQNYSERIWGNSDILAGSLQSRLAQAIATGQAPAKTIREIQDRFGVSQSSAARLVRTETNFFENKAELQAYKEMNIDKYVFVAVLDGRTSPMCQEHDGKIYTTKEATQGVDCPPLHPYCRSTIRPFVGKDYEPTTRVARNTDGQNVYVNQMSYTEWQDMFVQDIAGMIGQDNVTSTKGDMVHTDYGVSYDARTMWGMSSDSIQTTIDQVQTMMQKYPEVQRWLENGRYKSLEIRGGNLRRSVMANTRRTKPVITLSRSYYKDMERLSRAVQRGVKSEHFMPATDTKNYTYNHEFGHLIQNYLLNGKNTDTNARNMMLDIMKVASDKYKISVDDALALRSGYGKKSPREAFAEMFANLHSGKPNKLGKAIDEYLKGVIK